MATILLRVKSKHVHVYSISQIKMSILSYCFTVINTSCPKNIFTFDQRFYFRNEFIGPMDRKTNASSIQVSFNHPRNQVISVTRSEVRSGGARYPWRYAVAQYQ